MHSAAHTTIHCWILYYKPLIQHGISLAAKLPIHSPITYVVFVLRLRGSMHIIRRRRRWGGWDFSLCCTHVYRKTTLEKAQNATWWPPSLPTMRLQYHLLNKRRAWLMRITVAKFPVLHYIVIMYKVPHIKFRNAVSLCWAWKQVCNICIRGGLWLQVKTAHIKVFGSHMSGKDFYFSTHTHTKASILTWHSGLKQV